MDEIGKVHYPLLESINEPKDLRRLPKNKLPELCREIRSFLLDELSTHPGHLASSLGVVEIAVALHYVYITPYDRLVWDVGHQAYAHKVLTNRRKNFSTLREWGGMSGFISPEESPYDTFTSGHASNSISAALGMAVAAKQKNEPRRVVAIIGDGAMTGGLAFEGLNNASSFPNNMLVILNDNNISIDANVGGLNKYLVDINTSRAYNAVRFDLYRGMKRLNLIDEKSKRTVQRFNNSFKSMLSRSQGNFFDGLSIRYFGPVDGNDVLRLVDILSRIKEMEGPKLLHLRTIKGKGYPFAEASPTTWHAPGHFNIVTGEREKKNGMRPPKFQDVFGHTLVELAEQDERVVGITPAMPSGSSMNMLMKRFPERAYDVGIAESHAVTFAAGLAHEGMIPFCNIYSSFAQRSLDQIIHDVAIAKTPVIFCLDRAGLVGDDGATHQGAFDLAYLRYIPNLTIAAPIDEHWLRHLMLTAKDAFCPFVIRYPRGEGSLIDWHNEAKKVPIGKGRKLVDGERIAVLSIGAIGVEAREAVERLHKEGAVKPALFDMVFLKPIDEDILQEVFSGYDRIVTVEDGSRIGGLGSAVAEYMSERNYTGKLLRLGLPDEFIPHGSVPLQRSYAGIDAEHIYQSILSL